jgi:hypothetical protein
LSYHLTSADGHLVRADINNERFIMDSKIRTLVISVVVAVILWLLGGFVVGQTLGIIFVFLSIVVVGLAAGNLMDTPEPTSGSK